MRLATVDPLTGVANRRALDRHLAQACTDHGSQVGLLWVDVDEFKATNDTFGHAVGDAVLAAISERLQTCARADDVVGRLGGDEFLVVLRGADARRAEHVAERLRGAVADVPVATPSGPITVSVSVGASSMAPGAPEELLRRADAALYAAKDAGRNAVRTASA